MGADEDDDETRSRGVVLDVSRFGEIFPVWVRNSARRALKSADNFPYLVHFPAVPCILNFFLPFHAKVSVPGTRSSTRVVMKLVSDEILYIFNILY
jgi:hypothetical protein